MIYHHIVVAYDGSGPSENALRQAVKIVDERPGTRLTVAHVVPRPMYTLGQAIMLPEGYEERIREQEAALLQKAEQETARLPYAKIRILMGDPASAILEFAKEHACDLIVMGSRGLGAIAEWMLGSVSHQVAQKARVPVLIVK